MARPATGSVRWDATSRVWTVRVTLADGSRSKPIAMTGLAACSVAPDAPAKGCTCGPCKFAEEKGREVSRRMRQGGAVDASTALTVSEWFGKYYAAAEKGTVGRKNRGKPQASAKDRSARFAKWIEPIVGTKPIATVTAADLRRVVQALDEQVQIRTAFYAEREDATDEHEGKKPGLSPKTAANVYGEVTAGFAEATHSKLDELRVLEANPAIGVRPPTTGEDREQAALYPAEVVHLLSSPTIPRARRRVYFVALYTGMRRSEIERLTATDVDLEHGLITVRGKKTSAAKRQIPIEPALAPLLAILVGTRKTGALVDVPRADGKGGSSDLVKKDLERAGVTRADLSRDDAEHMPFTFHGMRHTAITHWAVAGQPLTWLLVVAGHTDAEMTRRYLDKAAVVRGRFGDPHPELPPEVMADLIADLEGVDVPEEFRSSFGISDAGPQKQSGEPQGFPAILTSPWRPQRESNPRYRRERPMS